MAQIKVFDLDSSYLLSELDLKEAGSINGGAVHAYLACVNTRPFPPYKPRRCLEAARDAYNRVLQSTGDRKLARTASLSTPA